MELQEEDRMEIMNTGNGNDDTKLDEETLQISESQENQDNTSTDMNIEDENTREDDEEDDEEKTKEEEEDQSRIDGSDIEANEKEEEEITKDEEIESDFYDSDLDLENLEGSDPTEIERKKQLLLEKRNKLIEFLTSKGADPEELLQLGVEQTESMTPPSSTRQKRKRSKRLSESPSYSLRDSKSRKGKSVKKTPKKETPEITPVYDDSKSLSDNKRERTTWTLSENRQLLKILETGQTDVQHIYKEMSKIPGRRKSIGHIRNKKSNLLQKAALKGTDMIDILREDISKSDETEVSTRSRRFQKEPEVYNDPLFNAVSSAEFSELKNLLISGLLENQRQIALLRRDFAHFRGLPTPPEVADILSDDEQDERTHDQLKSSNSGRKTLVIRKNKQKDVNNINLEEEEVVNE